MDRTSLLYVIATGPFVKIGRTSQPGFRLQVLQQHTPYPLELLAILPEEVCSEQEAQRAWLAMRVRGEWFHRTEGLATWALGLSRRHTPDLLHHLYDDYPCRSVPLALGPEDVPARVVTLNPRRTS